MLRGLLLSGVAACALAATESPASQPRWSNVNVGKITPGSGHVGVDIWWDKDGRPYSPCQHDDDPYYGSCVMSSDGPISYYKVQHYDEKGTDFPFGVFIDDANPNYCKGQAWCRKGESFSHGWGRLVTGAALEIYPHAAGGAYDPVAGGVGGLRIDVGKDGFPERANGGRYSKAVGNVALPRAGEEGVGKLNGFVTDRSLAAEAGRVSFDCFQQGSTRSSSTGYPLSGFASVKSGKDGYYSTGPVPDGSYKLYVTDNATGRKIVLESVSIAKPYERLDFALDEPCFGHSPCAQAP